MCPCKVLKHSYEMKTRQLTSIGTHHGTNHYSSKSVQNTVAHITHQPLYNTVCYNTILDITRFNNGFQKMYRLYRKMTIHGHFSI